MRGGTSITRGVQHAHRECWGAGREKTLRCKRYSRCAFRSTRDGGGSSNHRAIVCATLQGAPDHCSQLDRLRAMIRSEEHTSELQSLTNLVCRLLLEKKKKNILHSRHQYNKNYTEARILA